MTGQISFKVSGPWRMLVRQDNQDVRVINSNEDWSALLNNGAQTANFSVSMMSTDMPYTAQAGPADETKAFAPDPHEPDKTAEQREVAMDPEEKFREKRMADAMNRRAPGDGSPTDVQIQQGAKAMAQASGVPLWDQPDSDTSNLDGSPPGTDLDEAKAEEERKAKQAEEDSRAAGAKAAEDKEKERAAKEEAASTSSKSSTTTSAKKK